MNTKLNHTIRKFNRFELKYLITLQQAEKFKGALRDYMRPDEHGNDNGRYALTSLYFDSPDLRCYWEKEYGIRYRRKLRLRRYEGGELSPRKPPSLWRSSSAWIASHRNAGPCCLTARP